MGTFGPAVSSNDTYADIYAAFFDLYNDGLTVSEITKKLIDDHQETIHDADDANNFWFALAKAQWECKQLDKETFERVKKIIETGEDLERWNQLDAATKDIKKRKATLEKFLSDLQKERPKAKPRKKKIIHQPVFDKGDCLIFELENGNYGGAVVLETIRNTQHGYNLIAATRINQPDKPSKKDFEHAEVLVVNYDHWNNEPIVKWYLPIRHKQLETRIERVAVVDVQQSYNINSSSYGLIGDFDIWIITPIEQQIRSEKTKRRPSKKLLIRELIRQAKWGFI